MTSTTGAVFKTEFAVELHCEACVKTVKDALSRQKGVETYEISLKDQRVVVEGHAAPSQIARALKQDGRQVIVRGTGTMSIGDKNRDNENDGAAVCIFEAYTPAPQDAHKTQELHGLARMVRGEERKTDCPVYLPLERYCIQFADIGIGRPSPRSK